MRLEGCLDTSLSVEDANHGLAPAPVSRLQFKPCVMHAMTRIAHAKSLVEDRPRRIALGDSRRAVLCFQFINIVTDMVYSLFAASGSRVGMRQK